VPSVVSIRRHQVGAGQFLYLEGSHFYLGGRLSPSHWAILVGCPAAEDVDLGPPIFAMPWSLPTSFP